MSELGNTNPLDHLFEEEGQFDGIASDLELKGDFIPDPDRSKFRPKKAKACVNLLSKHIAEEMARTELLETGRQHAKYEKATTQTWERD